MESSITYDFSSRKTAGWLNNHDGPYWSLSDGNDGPAWGVNSSGCLSCSWLHVFETDICVECELVALKKTGRIGVMTRYTGKEAYVGAGYDFSKGKWFIAERAGVDYPEKIHFAAQGPAFPANRAILSFEVKGSHACLKVNKCEVISCTSLIQITAGKPGLFCEAGVVQCTFFHVQLLSRQGRMEYAVEHDYFLCRDAFTEGASLFDIDGQHMLINVYGELFMSDDNGSSFKPASKEEERRYAFFSQDKRSQYTRLHNGHILKIDNFTGGRSYLSKDNGITWREMGKLWNEEEIEQKWVFYGGMNDKLREVRLADGRWRVFYCADVRAFGNPEGSGKDIKYHWEEIWFTDDEGASWRRAVADSRLFCALDHLCESLIISCSDGLLRMYCTWNDSPGIRCFYSVDSGETWGGETMLPEMACPRSSIAIAEDPVSPGTYYMTWVYCQQIEWRSAFPRTRLALARSNDGIHWEYLMDVWRWDDIPSPVKPWLHQLVDPSITVTKDYVFVLCGVSEEAGEHFHQALRQKIVKIRKDRLRAYEAWPDEYRISPNTACTVRIEKMPRTTFHQGEKLDLSDGVLVIELYSGEKEYINMSSKEIQICEPDLTLNYTNSFPAPDMNLPGEKVLRITCRTLTVNITINVESKVTDK